MIRRPILEQVHQIRPDDVGGDGVAPAADTGESSSGVVSLVGGQRAAGTVEPSVHCLAIPCHEDRSEWRGQWHRLTDSGPHGDSWCGVEDPLDPADHAVA